MTLVQGDIVDVLKRYTREGRKFDYIYHDIWDKGDYEYLPWINYLIKQSQPLLAEGGEATAWNYETMIKTYIKECFGVWKLVRNDLSVLTPKKLKGMKLMWPLIAAWLVWAIDNRDTGRPIKRKKADEIARNLIKKPDRVMEDAFPGGSGD